MSVVTSFFDPKVVQDQARDQVMGDPVVSALSIPVVSIDRGDIDTEISASIAQIGICVLILPPSFHATSKNIRGPYFDKIRVTAEVFENPTINRVDGKTYVTAQQLAMIVTGALDFYRPDGISEAFYVTDVVPVPDMTATQPESANNIIHVEMTAGGGLGYAMPTIAPVTATVVAVTGGSVVTLSCTTPGAAIFYTTDGTYPSPRNATSQLVLLNTSGVLLNDATGVPILNDQTGAPILTTGPVNIPFFVPTGTTLKARAWLQGYLPAKPDQQVFNY